MKHAKIKAGEIFGALKVLDRIKGKSSHAYYLCLCECGKESTVRSDALRNGNTSSCGSGHYRIKHGETTHTKKSPAYNSWLEMRERCLNPKDAGYHNYGGRGIKLHTEWQKDFLAFYTHIGRRPEGDYSVERINNDGNYEPGNVKWATRIEQCNNTRRNVFVEVKGERLTIAQVARKYGFPYVNVMTRYRKGWRGDDLILPTVKGMSLKHRKKKIDLQNLV